MENCTVYYDDTRRSCREFAERFSLYEWITCKKASELTKREKIREENNVIGFLYESDLEKMPYSMKHIIWRATMKPEGYYFLIVTGGFRELAALKFGIDELGAKGYIAANVYSQYIFEKYHLNDSESIQKVVADMEKKETRFPELKNKIREMSRKELRKILYDDFKDYKKYRKENGY